MQFVVGRALRGASVVEVKDKRSCHTQVRRQWRYSEGIGPLWLVCLLAVVIRVMRIRQDAMLSFQQDCVELAMKPSATHPGRSNEVQHSELVNLWQSHPTSRGVVGQAASEHSRDFSSRTRNSPPRE